MTNQFEPSEPSDFDAVTTTRQATMVEVQLGGRRYPFRHSVKCKVCNSTERFAIEEALLVGRSYASIIRGLPDRYRDSDSADCITIDAMRWHLKQHMPTDVTVSRAVIEQRAQEMGRALDTMEGTLIDAYSVAAEVMRIGFERIARGEIKVGLDHTLAAAKMVSEMENKASASVDTTVQAEMVTLLLQHVRSMLSDEQFLALSENFKADPLFKGLMAKMRGDALPAASDSPVTS